MGEETKRGQKKIGIMGGTFDPIHTGHLILAEAAYESFGLHQVLVMPNGNPPHKPGQVQASMEERIQMTRLGIADNPHLMLSDFENTPQDYHYTYQTLEYLHDANPDTQYYFILGADSLMSFSSWMEPRRICQNCIILAATRYRMEHTKLEQQIAQLNKSYGAQIYLLETPNIDISSHMIRERLAQGKSIKYYVPSQVEAYILERGIYGPTASFDPQ
ncbi:MAG: nicotinate (nicotinamide) nucleotide adenylyltransferase [Lachnospiraceae bacterium]|nr:nicotinate (nicotinamide) nucleotide adenylyltransferase [Lachnospiraceae bacterium]